jgi:hypothetical protein
MREGKRMERDKKRGKKREEKARTGEGRKGKRKII